jgi:hypothetical protein
MPKTVIALLDDTEEARKAVEELLHNGFRKNDLGLIVHDVPAEMKAVLKDSGKGAALGALAGLLLAATTLMIPGAAPVLVAGPAATLTAGAVYGGLAGSIIGALTSKGVPLDEAEAFVDGLRRGGALLTVHAESDELARRALQILRGHGPMRAAEVYRLVLHMPVTA